MMKDRNMGGKTATKKKMNAMGDYKTPPKSGNPLPKAKNPASLSGAAKGRKAREAAAKMAREAGQKMKKKGGK